MQTYICGVLAVMVSGLAASALPAYRPDYSVDGGVDRAVFRLVPFETVLSQPNDADLFSRNSRRSRELFGKRSSAEVPQKRRTRELFGKRSVSPGSAEAVPFTSSEVIALAELLNERPRRARGTELFGR